MPSKNKPGTEHVCQRNRVEHLATEKKPFHFTDSGLPNVYLIGIKYFTCECGNVVAEIPALKPLMRLIARDLIANPGALNGEEIRFLRKRLGMRAVDFAKALGLEPETLSRIENNKQPASEQSDKLIRLVYALSVKDDPQLAVEAKKIVEDLISSWKAEHAPTRITKKISDNEWTDFPRAA
ncbi:MAG: helix-turn-helix domain-containing protein [Acidobacteriaceae bacterium]